MEKNPIIKLIVQMLINYVFIFYIFIFFPFKTKYEFSEDVVLNPCYVSTALADKYKLW